MNWPLHWKLSPILLAVLLLASCGPRPPATLKVAVAAGFLPALAALRGEFEQQCGCRLEVTAGASGLLYSQIREGGEYDVFLSADSDRPRQLQQASLIVPASRQTYARGQLALWVSRDISRDHNSGFSTLASLSSEELTPRQLILLLGRGKHRVVVADPQLAADGHSAVSMLKKLRLWPRLRSRMIYAGNAGHAQIMLVQGEGEMGLIPHSLALASGNRGQYMRVPQRFYPALNHQLVILRSTRERTLAIQFVQFLRSDRVQARLSDLGFVRGK
ncbi:molybdate ABC transporter substrate-binding protein [Microbulbifer celer]|uniref:Molybdate ABC transporter substrate-binding protein n=1 Tax=Microbulbifer celer TaxID=435905 RepID=A0ABW3U8C2_9GAMM|nr:molybdate ABC transporter substrate-binding protein [Microbulbifer celer]UFN57711.1 molybdate ABC transporter substrate-binding protein [Microbulbifer celer]